MSVPLAVVVKQQFEAAFALPRPFMVTFFRRLMDEMVSPLAVSDPQRKSKRREELNALLASNSEKNGPCGTTAWKKIVKDARRAYEGCFILLEYVRLCCSRDFRIFDMDSLRQKYAEIEAVDDTEAAILLKYRNVMMSALLSNSENLRKDMLIETCVRISEGAGAATKYARGGGKQRVATNNREIIFERESGVPPKACREACIGGLTSVSRANTVESRGSRIPCGQGSTRKKRTRAAPTPGTETSATSGNAAKRPRAHSLEDVGDCSVQDAYTSALACNSEMDSMFWSFYNEEPLGMEQRPSLSQASEGWYPAVVKQEPASGELRRDVPQGAGLCTASFGGLHNTAAIKCEPRDAVYDSDCDTRCPSPLGCELGMHFEPGLDCDATEVPAISDELLVWCTQ
jgi:hypothetical protein